MSYNTVSQPVESLVDDNYVENDEDIIVPDQPKPRTTATTTLSSSRTPIPSSKASNLFQISFYRQYFDLDSDIFFNKVQKSMNPISNEFNNEESNELYGFIWITGTLILFMFVSSTGSNILSAWIHSTTGSKYNYNFDLIFSAIWLFYGYNIIVPLLLTLSTSYWLKFPQSLSLTKIISIYGYTNILWIPITLLNLIVVVFINNEKHGVGLNIIEWLIVATSGVVTGLSNVKKISPDLKENCLLLHNNDPLKANRLFMGIVVALSIAHTLFSVIVKITFFGIQ
jgi:hypothetical protein